MASGRGTRARVKLENYSPQQHAGKGKAVSVLYLIILTRGGVNL
jgi:hypothetical protein